MPVTTASRSKCGLPERAALQLADLVFDFERAIRSETPTTTPWQRALYGKLAEAIAIPPLREDIKAATTSLQSLTKEVRNERLDFLSRLKDLAKSLF